MNTLILLSCVNISVLPLCALQTERLQALLADNEKVNLSEIEPIPLPLEPQIKIRGIVPETATLFKVQKTSSLLRLIDSLNTCILMAVRPLCCITG